MKTSPTQRSLKALRDMGMTCQVVERYNPFAKVRQDLFGIIDIVCLSEKKTIGVQTTTLDNMGARIKKMNESENLKKLNDCGWGIEVHGWRKLKSGWECKIINL